MNLPPPLPTPDSETQEMTRVRETSIGPYPVEVKLGDGGMGMVYKCRDPKLRRFVAVKVLKEKYARDQVYQERLRREARAIASLSHPNIAQIYAFEEGNGLPPYLVMECVEGDSAETVLTRGGPLAPDRAAALIRQTAQGLRAALEKGIIHRDIKPSNILITRDGSVKIVDFGLARVVEGAQPITDEGIVLGTPQYISPEQVRGEAADHRSDIYSLGATFYHLVTGHPPFEGDSQAAMVVAHLHETPRPPHLARPGVPEALSPVIGRMMAKDRERRYEGYGELITDLERLGAGQPLPQRTVAEGAATFRAPRRGAPAGFWWAALGAVALAVVATMLVARVYFPARKDEGPLGRPPDWAIVPTPGADVLTMDFGSLPAGLTRPEALQALLLLEGEDAERAAVEQRTAELRLEALSRPAAFRALFSRLDEVRVRGLRFEGHVDFGLALVDPRGAHLRSLIFVLRSGRPRAGDARRGEEGCPEPIRALRNGETVPLAGLPPAPLLLTGPYDLVARVVKGERSTRVHLDVHRPQGGSRPVFSTGEQGLELPGTDWVGGTLLIWPDSPLSGGSVRLGGLVAVGKVDDSGRLAAVPWPPEEEKR